MSFMVRSKLLLTVPYRELAEAEEAAKAEAEALAKAEVEALEAKKIADEEARKAEELALLKEIRDLLKKN